MTRTIHVTMFLGLATIACGGASQGQPGATPGAASAPVDSNAVFGPLEVGADWQRYTKVNTEPVESQDHGRRFVDTYVNDIGLEAYGNEQADIPVGAIIVKTSWERDGDGPSTTPGPIFVMEKRAPGFDDENGNWYYAIHWENPVEPLRTKLGGPIYWRSPSPKVNYCFDCHNDYARQLGMVPADKRAW